MKKKAKQVLFNIDTQDQLLETVYQGEPKKLHCKYSSAR